MRLIDADALKTVLQNDQRYNVKSFDKRYDNVGFSYDQVMFTIDKQPTIDAEPIVHAHWERIKANVYCTNCKVGYHDSKGMIIATNYPRCPNCGAHMDKEKTT